MITIENPQNIFFIHKKFFARLSDSGGEGGRKIREKRSIMSGMETSENNSQGLLAGKKILIVGVRNRRSIAHAIATRARREGAALAFAVQPDARDARGEGNKAAALVDEDFGGAPTVLCDASDDGDIAAAVQKSAKALGGLDGLVHAIAFARREAIAGAYHSGLDRAGFSEALDISAYTLTAFAKAALPLFAEGGGGSVVTLSYLGAERALPNYNVMGVAKAALEASVRYLAFGMGGDNIRVNAVSAGPIKTLSAAGIGGFGKILQQVEKQAPLRRNISAEEVAAAAVFLLSPLSSAITGEVIHADAGFHITAGLAEEE